MRRLSFLAIILAASLTAQTTAEITGRVVDPSKAAVPGATVTALNIDKQTERTTTSNDQGFYTLNSLDTGAYQITAQLAGFKALTRTGIKLDVNQSLRLDFALEVGQFSEKVQVVGEVANLETNTAQLGTVMTEEKIADLPLNARNFSQ
jgi:Carboxypeptidase regulatory-like domain